MRIGCPREIREHEYRVGLTPASVRELSSRGHEVLVESTAGEGAGFSDEDYRAAGAVIAPDSNTVFERAELLIKVKEPLHEERKRLRPSQTLFTYLHLASDAPQARDLIQSHATCIAYETVTDTSGGLPLLSPMSEIAGRLAVQAGAAHLEKHRGGRGVLLGGATGVEAASTVVLGGGSVGRNACRIALGLGARVTVLDRSMEVLYALERQFGSELQTLHASTASIEKNVAGADLVIGAVLSPGGAAPKIVPATLVARMRPGSVIVDVAIDQGGCFETSRPTSHAEPTFLAEGVVHYCVTNMPGAVPATASEALNNVTLPYILQLAELGVAEALTQNRHLRQGLNILDGQITHREVARDLGLGYVPAEDALATAGRRGTLV